MFFLQALIIPNQITNQVTIVDSGPISPNLPTGTPITSFQKAAISINIPKESRESSFSSASIILDCSLCTNSSMISISLCSNLEDDNCLEKGTFNLFKTFKKISAEWQSRKFPILKNSIYWLKVEGNANSFDQSFSWLDAANFQATEAFTNEHGIWTLLPDVIGASTLVFTVQ